MMGCKKIGANKLVVITCDPCLMLRDAILEMLWYRLAQALQVWEKLRNPKCVFPTKESACHAKVTYVT